METVLQGKSALITGGTKGIGLGIAEKMSSEKMCVAITGRNSDEVHEITKYLSGLGAGDTLGFHTDVRDREGQRSGVQEILARWGQLDVVIANAGVGHFAPVDKMTDEEWDETIDTNLTGVFNTVKATIEALKTSKGYIITIASLAGTNFFTEGAAYNASKFGLVGFSQAIMLDVRKYGVKVSTIMPGSVATYFNGRTPGEKDAWKIQPEDIGQLVVDLLKMDPRTLPSKIEVRPSIPSS